MFTPFADRPARYLLPGERKRALARTPKTCDCLHQFILAVPGYSGDAQNFTSPDLETDPPHLLMAAVRFHLQIINAEHRLRWMRFTAFDREQNLATDHKFSQVLLIRL